MPAPIITWPLAVSWSWFRTNLCQYLYQYRHHIGIEGINGVILLCCKCNLYQYLYHYHHIGIGGIFCVILLRCNLGFGAICTSIKIISLLMVLVLFDAVIPIWGWGAICVVVSILTTSLYHLDLRAIWIVISISITSQSSFSPSQYVSLLLSICLLSLVTIPPIMILTCNLWACLSSPVPRRVVGLSQLPN